jgi:4-amino-4-deoxy-L-arabinose transferase-like glycosyltransferase
MLIRELFGSGAAIWSLLALSSFGMLYGNGRSVLGEVPGLFFLTLTLLFLHRLERSSYADLRMYVLSGLAAGLCIVTKPIFILLLPAVGIVLSVRFRSIPIRWGGFAVACAFFLIPVAVWVRMQFGVSASISGTLNFYLNPYDVGNVSSLAFENIRRFFTELTPLYTLVLASLWGVSLFVRRKYVSATELVAFVFCAIVMLAYLRMPGWYRYLFPATTMALLFLAPSIFILYEKGTRPLGFLRRLTWVPYLLIGVLFLVQAAQYFTTSYVASYFNSSRTLDLQTFISGLPKTATVYFYNVPEAAFFASNEMYYQYIKPHPAVGILGADTLRYIEDGSVDYIVVGTGSTFDAGTSKYQAERTFNRYTILKKK